MNFIEDIFLRLTRTPTRPVLQEIRDGRILYVTCEDFLGSVRAARTFAVKAGLKKGDRCALLGHNSIHWAAIDLGLMAEGIIVVPLYARQAPVELVGMLRDSGAALIVCGDHDLLKGIAECWPQAPPIRIFEDVLSSEADPSDVMPPKLADHDPVTIIYTSGTSGEPKGVILNTGNVTYMLKCTNSRLDLLMDTTSGPDRVFHYLPFCFAGSWILMLTCFTRDSLLTLSTDLNKLAEELRIASPQYFLNVPILLERIRSGIEDQMRKKNRLVRTLYQRGQTVWVRRNARTEVVTEVTGSPWDSIWLSLANTLLFPAIRKKLGPHLKALICGSAPLAPETQRFFMMIGIRVLQVYGLTETTAICTMDHPYRVEPGRVGPAISGIEMKLGEGDEILVRGPNIFPGYWGRPDATAAAIQDGWFRTGDQGDMDESGNWRIIGRVKNVIVLSSGHNVPPEPIEELLLRRIPGAEQVILVGHGRSFLSAFITGDVDHRKVGMALDAVNRHLPHYKRVRAFHLHREPFTIESGLLTANGKLKREAIAAAFKGPIESLYLTKKA